MDIAELYKIIYYGPDDHLRGAIVVCDSQTGFQFLYKDDSLDTYSPRDVLRKFFTVKGQEEADKISNPVSQPFIKKWDYIMLSGPNEASIGFLPDFSLSCFLFGDIRHALSFKKPDDSRELSVPLRREYITRDGNRMLTILYAYFEKAVEAHVKVKIVNVSSAFGIYGVIAARTSAIESPAYSSLLFCQDEDEKFQVKRGNGDGDLSLSRSIVGVPLGSELILQFDLCLCSANGDKMMTEFRRIDVTENETSSKTVRLLPCGNQCLIVAEINWRSKRESKP
ncbi:uncharacterized protein LOC141668806 [Apium graveolens]|uniref:uncharacterized protein LOC141668806 n=1 Tax=Apium graveolens TaxID=4045 RepID=UPI003D798B32